jgi:adenylate cyclase class 2
MNVEIEAKIKVESLEVVRQRLSELSADFVEERIEQDWYFDDNNAAFRTSDKALRLRCLSIGDNQAVILTYKGPKMADDYKKRVEIELEVSCFESAEKILSQLGYNEAIDVKKCRQLWKYQQCEVALDDVEGLGFYVEIEGPKSEIIHEVQKKLGLAEKDHIPESYADLICKLRQ